MVILSLSKDLYVETVLMSALGQHTDVAVQPSLLVEVLRQAQDDLEIGCEPVTGVISKPTPSVETPENEARSPKFFSSFTHKQSRS
jgi:hypothetical protein